MEWYVVILVIISIIALSISVLHELRRWYYIKTFFCFKSLRSKIGFMIGYMIGNTVSLFFMVVPIVNIAIAVMLLVGSEQMIADSLDNQLKAGVFVLNPESSARYQMWRISVMRHV